jgi:beta-glucanase (GH16 family)
MQEEKMKRSVNMMIVMFIMTMFTSVFAQASHTINFTATTGVGADWNWVVLENGTNPPLVIMDDPPGGKPNNCGQFTALQTGKNWAMVYTTDDGEFTFSSTNSTVSIKVYKPIKSKVTIKFEGSSAPVELSQTNTVANAWETLTYDFSAHIGKTYNKLIIIPDYVEPYVTGTDRTQNNVCYIDDIVVPDGVVPSGPATAAPTPTNNQSDVISVYSDAFTNISPVNYNPYWSQTTVVTVDYPVAGNNTLLYENLNYQGTDWNTIPQNVSGMEYLHVDFWTANSSDLGIYLISPGPAEKEYVFTINSGVWNSVDIPVTYFEPTVDLTQTIQFKVEGNGDIYFDNWYFWKTAVAPGEDTRLSDLKIDGETIWGFESNSRNYDYEVPVGYSGVPAITCTLNDPLASYVIYNAASVPGVTEVRVTAQNGTTVGSYWVNFTSKGYTLIWSDEFNQALTQPDPVNWSYDTGYGPSNDGWGNDEWQLYTNSVDNVKLQSGNLVISALCPSGTPAKRNGSITSGRIKTQAKFDARFGLFQARVKAPTGKGMWSAFWTLGANYSTVGWPYCGEMDIMEVAPYTTGTKSSSIGAVHWWEDTANAWWYNSYTNETGIDLSNDYHIYEIDWEYDRIIGKIDGMPYFQKDVNWIGMKEFLDEFFILFNVAVGGTLGGAPDGTTVWPQNMYVDWVRVYQLNTPSAPITQAPIPIQDPADVISIYGDHYNNINNVDYNIWWDVAQTTFVIQDYPIANGDSLNYYDNLNFQGTDFNTNKQNVSGMDYLHVDYWPHAENTLLTFYVCSGTWGVDYAEYGYTLTINNNQWNSIDIPLSVYAANGVDLTKIGQFKVEGNGNVWFDNFYFWDEFYDPLTDATLSDLKVNGTTITGFLPILTNYEYQVPNGTVTVPTVIATTTNTSATKQIINAASLPGITEVAVTAQDGVTTKSYFVDFTYIPVVAPPVPTHAPADVISVYSETYTNITPVNYKPAWGQSTIVTVDYDIAGAKVLYYDNLNYQGTDWNTIPQNVSTYNYLHVDFWANSKTDSLSIFLISTGPVEAKYNFTVTPHQWNSVEIPLTHFSAGGVDLTNAIQFKVEGNGDIWVDNLYFYKSTAPSAPANVVVTTTATNVTLTWDAVSGATSYIVYSSVDPYGIFTINGTGTFAGSSWTAPFNGTKMFYYVKASNSKAATEVK